MTLVASRPRETKRAGSRPTIVRQVVLVSVLVVGCWATLLAVAVAPSDTAVLISTSPGNGETARPERLLLTFDRPVSAGFVTVRMTDPYKGKVVLDRPHRVEGRADTIAVPMPKIQFAGTYTVAWRMPSSQLAPVGGTYTFDFVSKSPVHPPPRISTDRSAAVVAISTMARFAAFGALAVLVGAAFFVAAIWPEGARRVRRLLMYAWLGLVVATLVVLLSFGSYAAWTPLTDALDPALLSATFQSQTGAALLARLLVLLVAGFGIAELVHAAPTSSARERWLRGGGVLGCTAALAATWSLVSHSASGSLVPLGLGVDVLHLTAMAIWIGGLVVLFTVTRRGSALSAWRTVVSKFSRLTWVCLGLLVLSGGYLDWREAHGFGAFTVSYGLLLVGKLALVIALAVIALRARSWRPRQNLASEPKPQGSKAKRGRIRGQSVVEFGRLRRLVAIETGLAAAILAVTALLVVSQPARDSCGVSAQSRSWWRDFLWCGTNAGGQSAVRQLPPPVRLAFDTGGPGGKGALDLVVVPASVGPNRLHFSVLDGQGEARGGIGIKAVLRRSGHHVAPVRAAVRELALGHLTGTLTIPARGKWELVLTIRSVGGHRQTITGVVDVG